MYYFFLDESGDHGLNFIDYNFPIFILAGCLFKDEDYAKLEENIKKLKIDFFGSEQVILHSREIRKCEGCFQTLFDLEKKKNFMKI